MLDAVIPWLAAASCVLLLSSVTWSVVQLVGTGSLDVSGTVAYSGNLSEYGFGAERRKLLVNITEMGGYAAIDPNTKKHATMRVYQGDSFQLYDIGVEFKGEYHPMSRYKKNYDVEIWEPDGVDANGEQLWDDANERLYFAEKMSDFVLRGGADEPTAVRDAAAPAMSGLPYETALVELLLVLPGDVITYEGVYLMLQKPTRRALEKILGWSANGKFTDCDEVAPGDEAAAAAETAMLLEVDDGPDECLLRHGTVKTDYPKCDKLVGRAECVGNYTAALDWFATLLTVEGQVGPELNASMENFARALLTEQLMVDDGFMQESESFYASPVSEGGGLRTLGVVNYDQDERYWKCLPEARMGDMVVLNSADRPRADVYLSLLAHAPFQEMLARDGPRWMQEIGDAYRGVISTRLAQVRAGNFDREVARWPVYSGRWMNDGSDNYRSRLTGAGGCDLYQVTAFEASLEEEVLFLQTWLDRRVHALNATLHRGGPFELVTVRLASLRDVYAFFLWLNTPLAAFTVSCLVLWLCRRSPAKPPDGSSEERSPVVALAQTPLLP